MSKANNSTLNPEANHMIMNKIERKIPGGE